MGKGNKQNFARKRKRKGHGNQYTKQHCKYKKAFEKGWTNSNHNESSNVGGCMPCTSEKKMKPKAMTVTLLLFTCQFFSAAGYIWRSVSTNALSYLPPSPFFPFTYG